MSLKSLSAAALALVLGLSGASAGAMSVQLTPSNALVRVGDGFDLVVSIAGAQDAPYAGDEVLAFGFDVDVGNPSLAYWSGAVVANPPFPDDASALFLNTDVAGSVGFGLGVMDDAFTLAVLSFVALAEGSVDLGIVSDLLDLNEGLVYLSGDPQDLTAALSVTIHPRSSTPVPATLALLLIGLPWLRARLAR